MGADSISIGDESKCLRMNRKVIRHGEMLVGGVGHARALQIIEHCCKAPEWEECEDAIEYLVGKWIPAVRESLSAHGYAPQQDGRDEGDSAFLVAARSRVFFIGGDFGVDEYETSGAIGSGESYAFGALYASTGLPPAERVRLALEAAGCYCTTVSAPFYIEKL